MGKRPLLDEGIEDLCVEEVCEEWPLGSWAMLKEELLIKQEGRVPGPLGGGREEGAETLPGGRENG